MKLQWSFVAMNLFGLGLRAALAQTDLSVEEPVIVRQGDVDVVPLPIDSLPSEVSADDQLLLDEVILKPDATLVLPPFRSVVINHLIAEEGAKIQIAQSGSGENAGFGVDGGDGANVRFFVRSLKGHVVLEARGGRGGNGRDGRHGRQGKDGERGRNARTLIFGLFYLGDGEDGRPGYPGEDGEDGENGGNGGDGGRITFYFQSKTLDSKIFVDVAGGEAGRGGRAGLGGLGGNGGAGGKGIKSGRQGPMGRRGQNGKSGQPGIPGTPGQAAVYQVDGQLYECLMTLDALDRAHDLYEEDFEACKRDSEGFRTQAQVPLTIHSSLPVDVTEKDGMVFISSDGRSGKSAHRARIPGETPSNGSPGSDGGVVTLFVNQLPEHLNVTARGGDGGHGADGAAGLRGRDGADGRNAGLFKSAEPGENGQDGGHGGHGSDGGQGGKGGKIRIVYLQSGDTGNWMERITADVSGGVGGTAGRGALGGPGGLGGRGGKKFWSSKREPDGLAGQDGMVGRDGEAGESGEPGQIEIFEAESFDEFILEEFREILRESRNE